MKQIISTLLLSIIFSACNLNENIELKGALKPTSQEIHQLKLEECYKVMLEKVKQNPNGTRCGYCLDDELAPGNTITIYSYFYNNNYLKSFEDPYKIQWALEGYGGKIVSADTLRYIQVLLNSANGSDSLNLSFNNEVKIETDSSEIYIHCGESINLNY